MSSIVLVAAFAAGGPLFLVGVGLVILLLARLDRMRAGRRRCEEQDGLPHQKIQRSWSRLLNLEKGESAGPMGGKKRVKEHKLDLAAFFLLFIDTLIAFTGLLFAFAAA